MRRQDVAKPYDPTHPCIYAELARYLLKAVEKMGKDDSEQEIMKRLFKDVVQKNVRVFKPRNEPEPPTPRPTGRGEKSSLHY